MWMSCSSNPYFSLVEKFDPKGLVKWQFVSNTFPIVSTGVFIIVLTFAAVIYVICKCLTLFLAASYHC